MKEFPKIVKAQFITSATNIKNAPPPNRSEVVFMGRSNVGKSSTINTLTNQKGLAKSSSTPGKTQLINFFDVTYKYNDNYYPLYFVDLPGFGYAKVSKATKEIWQKNLIEFITKREAIRVFIHLRDARHPKSAIDEGVYEYLLSIKKPDQEIFTIFTKGDKLKQKEKAYLKKEFPNAIVISNLKKINTHLVHQKILSYIYGVDFD